MKLIRISNATYRRLETLRRDIIETHGIECSIGDAIDDLLDIVDERIVAEERRQGSIQA